MNKTIQWDMSKDDDKQESDGKSILGRPTIYNIDIAKRMVEFFERELTKDVVVKSIKRANGDVEEITERVANRLPSFVGFSRQEDLSVRTFEKWAKDDRKPHFVRAHKYCKQLQEKFLNDAASAGLFNATYAKFLASNITEMRDRRAVDVDHTTKGDKISNNAFDMSKLSEAELRTWENLTEKAKTSDDDDKS